MAADSEPDPDPIEEILTACLQEDPGTITDAVEAACTRHPELASALRDRFTALQAMGMVELPVTGGEVPEQLGPFRLLRRLGSGGMGVVYLAEQEPLGRQVALKLIRPEHLFFPGAHARFTAEAEVIARLEHPGIVPIYTFGEEQGIPYFAMEYVDGETIGERIGELARREQRPQPTDLYASGHRNWSEAACAIMLQVAQALQHAHDRNVVHRDVKPSNIILTKAGRALLLDFGLAFRADGARLTRSGTQPGSVAYMSPEQVRGEEVDGRTDVYSLGVTMYELLSLQAPFLGGSLQDVQKRVLRGTPVPLRDVDRRIDRDAAVICSKAMAPEQSQRYPSAAALAADLEALLQRRPIAARPAGPWLRARRFAQRRPTLTASLVLSVLLVVGVPLLLFVQERTARLRIAEQADTAVELSDFMIGLFAETTPDRARGETVPARIALDRGVRTVHARFGDRPLVKSKLLLAMGNAYVSLGLFAEAEPVLVEALALRERHGSNDIELVRCRHALGALRYWRGELRAAARLRREALVAMVKLEQTENPEFAAIQHDLALSLLALGRADEARDLLRQSTELLRRADLIGRRRLPRNLGTEIRFLTDHGELAEARRLSQEQRQLLDELYPGDHPDKVSALERFALLQARCNEDAAAEKTFIEALRMAKAVFDPDHPVIAEVQENYASILRGLENIPRAQRLLSKALSLHRRTYPERHPTLARALFRQSRILLDLGDITGGDIAAAEALTIADEVWPDGHDHLISILSQRAWSAFQYGDLALAESFAQRAVDMAEELDTPRRGEFADALRTLAMVQSSRRTSGGALAMARRALAIEREWNGSDHPDVAQGHYIVAYVLICYGKPAEALPEAKAGLAMLRRVAHEPHANIAWGEYLIGWALLESGDAAAAAERSRRAAELYSDIWPPEHPVHSFPLNNLGVALARLNQLDDAENGLQQAYQLRRNLPDGSGLLAISRLNLAAVRNLRGNKAEAEQMANECLEHLPADSLQAEPCLFLLWQLLQAREAPTADWQALHDQATKFLPTEHKLLRALAELR